jgi:hypothetical protein
MADANCKRCRQSVETVRISRQDFLRLPEEVRDHKEDILTVITVRNGQRVKLPVEIVRPPLCDSLSFSLMRM